MKRMNGRVMTAVAAVVTVGFAVASENFTSPVLVDAALKGKHWTTVYTNEVLLRWDWASNVTQVTLAINGMNSTFVTNFTTVTSNYLWHAFASDRPPVEDVYDLTLTSYTNGTAVVGAMTSRLAVVTGAFGQTPVDPVAASAAWAKVRDNVVLPFDAAWSGTVTNAATAQLVIAKVGGITQTNAFTTAAGYAGWKLRNSSWGYGTFDLTLTFPGATNVWGAELLRPLDGTMIRVQ